MGSGEKCSWKRKPQLEKQIESLMGPAEECGGFLRGHWGLLEESSSKSDNRLSFRSVIMGYWCRCPPCIVLLILGSVNICLMSKYGADLSSGIRGDQIAF